MSESIKDTTEQYVSHEELKELPEYAGETVAELVHEQPKQNIEAIRQNAEQEALQTEAVVLPNEENDTNNAPPLITSETKQAVLNSTLKHVQRRLPTTERVFSRFAHQSAVKAVSEVGSKTVSRPSGLLGGGVCAFLGSASYLYLAKHIGFHYNYLLFLMFFGGGFVLGIIIELLLFLARPNHR
ncbi:MAG TPA: hypothetical protein VFN56_04460 [Candidatus Saccharimonadales bacterium]|nr:hypothetical protein [Candidatus Saccharimonadales bacterium]